MKLGTCNEYFENWPIEDVFNYAAEIGYDGVEIAPFTLASTVEDISAARRSEIRRAAERAAVEIIGLHWLLISPEGLYTNHPDDAIRNRTRDYFKALIQFCGDLGGDVMIIGSPKQRNVQEGWDFQETWDRTRGVFEDCLPLAEQCGVYLCIEPLSADELAKRQQHRIVFLFHSRHFSVVWPRRPGFVAAAQTEIGRSGGGQKMNTEQTLGIGPVLDSRPARTLGQCSKAFN